MGAGAGEPDLRVIHFVPYYPPDRIGGVGEFAAALHEGLLRRGVESTLVTRGRAEGGAGVERIAVSRVGWFLKTLLWARRAAACDVVHCHAGEALPLLLVLRLWPGRRARVLATFHVSNRAMARTEAPYTLAGRRFGSAPSPGRRLAQALAAAADAAGLRLADASNCVSRSTARDLVGDTRGAGLHVIYNGVPTTAERGEAAEPVELFYAGLPSHRKRVLALPYVLAAVRRTLPTARLRIAGFAAAEAPELTALIEELGLVDAVECIGPQTGAALPAHYRAAGVALVPSVYEGLPYAILEALREGTPVVATRVSGHPEVIEDGVNGFLVPVDDPEAMATRCVEILQDPALAERLGAAARQRIERDFGLERQVAAYLVYYRSLTRETS